jgi:hypothetical protein
MAAISQKVSPGDVLPLLARNVVIEGYSGAGRRRKPTEFLTLLMRYVEQARELQALAGSEGVIRISDCREAQPLLTTLGYRLAQPCGPGATVETADPKKAFLTVDSAFPLADLEQAMRGGKPFVHAFPSTQVPVLFTPGDWTALSRHKSEDVLDVLLHDPAVARLYWALARIEEHTREAMHQSPGLQKLVALGPVLDFYGSHLYIQAGRVVVPGGASAEAAWTNLVGASPESSGDFITRLLARDEGWLAAYFDALSRVGSRQQSYFTQPERLRRFYEALRGRDATPGPAQPIFRPNPDLLLLATRFQLEKDGRPRIPGDLKVWKEILRLKSRSRLVREWAGRAEQLNTPEDVLEAMIALSRVPLEDAPPQVFLVVNEIDRRRPPHQPLSPQTVRRLAENFARFKDQYLVFSEFYALSDDSIARFLAVADALDQIPDNALRGDAVGIFQAHIGLWQILARQEQIPQANWNRAWQQVISPFAQIRSAPQLFDATRISLGELLQAAGHTQVSQNEIITLLAGPKQSSPEGQKVRKELASRIASVLEAQRLISLDTLFALGEGMKQLAQGQGSAEALLPLAAELQEFEVPKPLFTSGERTEWAFGLYGSSHLQYQLRLDLTRTIKSPVSSEELAAARGRVVPFLRDTLVGLNYAYYQPPAAQMLHNNPLFVRSHDFSMETTGAGDRTWLKAHLYGRGYAASGGAHLAGSLAELPYVLAGVEQNFIVPENVQSLIWEDLVPSLITSAVLPRWWRVTRNELRAVTLYQRYGEELLAAASGQDKLRQEVVGILAERLLPQSLGQVERALRSGQREAALRELAPGEIFYLAAEFRRRFPTQTRAWGTAGQELDALAGRYPEEVSWERLSEDFGVPHPALARTNTRELLSVKPIPTFMGYSSRLMAESWDSNNLYWARLADESGFPPVILNLLIPELTHRMVRKIFATHLEDWPALLRALRETGEEFRQGRVASFPSSDAASTPRGGS